MNKYLYEYNVFINNIYKYFNRTFLNKLNYINFFSERFDK